MWRRWSNRWSPNCTLVLRSVLTSLVSGGNGLAPSSCHPRMLLLILPLALVGDAHHGVCLKDMERLSDVPLHKVKLWYTSGVSNGGPGNA